LTKKVPVPVKVIDAPLFALAAACPPALTVSGEKLETWMMSQRTLVARWCSSALPAHDDMDPTAIPDNRASNVSLMPRVMNRFVSVFGLFIVFVLSPFRRIVPDCLFLFTQVARKCFLSGGPYCPLSERLSLSNVQACALALLKVTSQVG